MRIDGLKFTLALDRHFEIGDCTILDISIIVRHGLILMHFYGRILDIILRWFVSHRFAVAAQP